MQLTTNVLDLAHLVNAALLFSAKTDDLEPIHGVHLERLNDELLAVSTDRVSLGVSSIPATYDTEDEWCTFIPFEDMRTLKIALRAFGTAKKRKDIPVTLTSTGGTLTVTLPSQELNLDTRNNTAFPDWRALLFNHAQGHRAEFDPAALDKFGRADLIRDQSARAVMEVGAPARPARVTISDYFVGLLMPMKANPTPTPTLLDRLQEGN